MSLLQSLADVEVIKQNIQDNLLFHWTVLEKGLAAKLQDASQVGTANF
jgi:hypothetical protein